MIGTFYYSSSLTNASKKFLINYIKEVSTESPTKKEKEVIFPIFGQNYSTGKERNLHTQIYKLEPATPRAGSNGALTFFEKKGAEIFSFEEKRGRILIFDKCWVG